MKKKALFILICFLSMVNYGKAQNVFYDLFAVQGTEWSIGNYGTDAPDDLQSVALLRLSDTICIEGAMYNKLVEIDSLEGEAQQDYAYLRVDVDSCLFFRDLDGDEEKLFDYRAEAGDTIRTIDFWIKDGNIRYDNVISPYYLVVESVSQIEVNGENRTSWDFILGNFTQGIGSISSMKDFFVDIADLVGVRSHVLCVYLENDQLYQNPDYNYCLETLIEMELKNDFIGIFPNPVCSQLYVEGFKGVDGELSIYTLDGIEILQTKITGRNMIINFSENIPGLYVLVISTKDSIIRRQFVKIRN